MSYKEKIANAVKNSSLASTPTERNTVKKQTLYQKGGEQ
jgi:hypothetical protein